MMDFGILVYYIILYRNAMSTHMRRWTKGIYIPVLSCMDNANGSCTATIFILPFAYCIMQLNRLLYNYVYLCLIATVIRGHSQLYVFTVCTLLQLPFPAADSALTLTLYLVSAFSPVRIAKTAEVEALVQERVSFVY